MRGWRVPKHSAAPQDDDDVDDEERQREQPAVRSLVCLCAASGSLWRLFTHDKSLTLPFTIKHIIWI